MRRFRDPTFLVTVAVLVAIGAYFLIQRSLGVRVEGVPAAREHLTQTVAATGRVITPARIELGAVTIGTIASVLAREGAQVDAGAVLATLKDDELRAAAAQARASLAEAETRITQIGRLSAPVSDQTLRQAEANFEFARDELERVKKLAEKGFFSSARVDEVERNFAVARAARDAAGAQAATNQPKGADHQLAIARRAQALAALEVANARLDNTRIRTPAAGTVLRRLVEPGDVVAAGKVLFELAAAGGTQVVLQVDEKNLGLLRLGQPALALADAFPGQRFAAAVSYIAPGVDAQRGTVEVKLTVAEPPAFVRPDMTVSVEIDAGRAENAIVVPTELLREAGSGRPWVLVARDGRAVRQPVKLGLRGAGRTQIVEGVAAGEIVLPTTVAVAPDAKVRASVAAAPKPVLRAQEILR